MLKAREKEREKIKNLTSNIIYYFSHYSKSKNVTHSKKIFCSNNTTINVSCIKSSRDRVKFKKKSSHQVNKLT